MKSLRKLSLAAVISVGVLSIGNLVQAQTSTDPCDNRTPSSYGAGAAGSFKAYGTENAQPAAGSTEISTFRSPSNMPSGSNAAMAAQGIYGNCAACPQPAPIVAPVVIPCPPTSTGGASEIIIEPSTSSFELLNPTVSTPTDSNMTGGAASAESQGMNCVTVPVTPPSITGAAIPVCPPPACIPQACPTAPSRSSTAPNDFNLPNNPNAFVPIQTPACPSGGAAPIAPVCPPMVPVCPSGAVAPMAPMMMQTQTCPTSYPTAYTMPVTPAGVVPTAVVPTTIFPSCPTGGAASISGPVAGTCMGSSQNTQYVEKQIYAYPSVAGMNTVTGAADQALSFGDQLNGFGVTSNLPRTAMNYGSSNPVSITGAAAPIYMTGSNSSMYMTGGSAPVYMTGGASPYSCPGLGPVYSSGAPVSSMFFPEGSNTPMSIQTSSGYQLQRMVVTPGCATTGAAAPIYNQFGDIPNGFWASDDINRLASAGVVAGYPDRTFKPNLPVSRAELSSMLVSGLNIQNTPAFSNQVFRDVPSNHWANNDIDKSYNRGLVSGYPDSTFRPNSSVTVAESLTIMSKSIPGDMTADQANQILRDYSDASNVPSWAVIPIAKSLKAGLTRDFPSPNQINPNQTATRAQIASMLSQLRQTLAIEPTIQPKVTGAAANIQQETVTVPTLNVKFNGRITARASHVGESFDATTLEPVTINNQTFPAGSIVNGKIVEVIRPSTNNPGALKVAFTDIKDDSGRSAPLPRDVISARVMSGSGPNVFSRIVEFPFTWIGRLAGVTGRTLGGATVIAGNSSEQFVNGLGISASELTSRQWGQAGKSAADAGIALVKAPVDIARTALSGATGLLNVTADQLGFLVNPSGNAVASINPKESVSIAFGCQQR